MMEEFQEFLGYCWLPGRTLFWVNLTEAGQELARNAVALSLRRRETETPQFSDSQDRGQRIQAAFTTQRVTARHEQSSVQWSDNNAFQTFRPRLRTVMYICDNPPEMTEQPQPQRTKVSVFSRIRRSFRRKKESYCINCGHVTKNCYHSKDIYENVEFNNKDDLLKWLDLDLSHGHGVNNNPIRLKYQVTCLGSRHTM